MSPEGPPRFQPMDLVEIQGWGIYKALSGRVGRVVHVVPCDTGTYLYDVELGGPHEKLVDVTEPELRRYENGLDTILEMLPDA
jgi:hypothetical protein